MPPITKMTLESFLTETAAKQPTPGGGSVTALAAALGASLAAMALRYTAGKKAYAQHEPEIQSAIAELTKATTLLQELIEEDIAAYNALSPLLKLPEDQRASNPDYTTAVVAAIRAPETTAALANAILHRTHTMLDKTNKLLLSDLAIAATLAHAAVHASQLNVLINLPLLPNKDEAATQKQNLQILTDKADKTYTDIRTHMLKIL
jgi:formiminotetrahydrofolate cyclodeaminase